MIAEPPAEPCVEILTAEDSPTQALQLGRILEKHGMRVTSARNGREALEMLEKHAPTLVITDIQMPEMDGYELCRRIKAHARLLEVPVILLTSLSDVRDIVRGLQCGADNFVVKPYEEELLLSRIRDVLENQKLADRGAHEKGIDLCFGGERMLLSSRPAQMIGLLVSTYQIAVEKNLALHRANAAMEEKARELSRSNAELARFGHIISHDLKEPLRTISSFLQLLERRCRTVLDATAAGYITMVIDGASRMRNLIDALLEYSQVGRREPRFVPCDCQAILSLALRNLQVAIEESGAEVTHDPMPTVSGDEVLLGQLLQNLIGNALKFRKPGVPPRVHIGLRREGATWQFSVKDEGIGIAPEHFERVFEIFQRLHAAKEYPGTGMGLAICKKIVELHGGRISLQSQPGAGTSFFFSIPESGASRTL